MAKASTATPTPTKTKRTTSSAPLTKVTLYKHGMGYFERKTRFKGPGEIELQCGHDEIDDMLKSLIVLNVGGGRVSSVTYDSAKTLETRLSEFGFDLRSCAGLLDLIVQIKGAPVTVTVGKQTVAGRVIGLDTNEVTTGDRTTQDHLLVLFCKDFSMRRINLSSITDVSIDDTALAGEIQQQLELLFQAARKKDRKLLKVELLEETERDLIIAYSIPTPIWKTSYRLVLTSENKLLIQGMAIVDNTQEDDWNDVQVVLISAAPISFIQPLYDPVQPPRRRIAAQGVVSTGPFVAERAQQQAPAQAAKARARMDAPMPACAPPAAPGAAGGMYPMAASMNDFSSFGAAAEGTWGQPSQGVAVQAQETGELFEYRIEAPVTVPRNSSALIPIVQEIIEGERLSLFNASRNHSFPYASIRLVNTTGLTLEAGPVTIMEEEAYAGEALLDVVKPNDTRFLPYALDQGVKVVIRDDYQYRPVHRVRVWHGVLFTENKQISCKTYNLENLSHKKKTIFVEHPYSSHLKLISDVKPEETTENFYRYRVVLEAHESYALEVKEETESTNQYRLDASDGSLGGFDFDWFLKQNYSDAKFLEFLQELIVKRKQIVALNVEAKQLKERLAQYQKDQERARENVKTLGGSGDRFKQAIEEAEDKIVKTTLDLEKLATAIEDKRQEISEFVSEEMMAEIK